MYIRIMSDSLVEPLFPDFPKKGRQRRPNHDSKNGYSSRSEKYQSSHDALAVCVWRANAVSLRSFLARSSTNRVFRSLQLRSVGK
jgi:hypothetical protein